jgi:ribosomal protein S1
VYVKLGNVLGYLPLRSMANPAPRSAREQVKIGQAVSLVVDSFVPSRRSIDVAIVGISAPKVGKVAKKKRVLARKAAVKKK